MKTVSLRRRVTAMSMIVLAAVLLAVGVFTDVAFAAQSRAELRSQLAVRAELAGQLMAQGLTAQQVAEQVETPGISATLVGAGGQRYSPRWRERWGGPDRNDQTLVQPLPDGSQLTLVASARPVSGAQALLRRTLIVLSVAALVVAGLVMLVTTRIALAPLDAMTAVARSITRGDRGQRLAPSRTDTELGRAAAAFDTMLDALEGSEARTRQFVADAAHELRTPLAGVQAIADAVLAPDLPAPERERLTLLLLRESRRAGRLVDDLLVLARLDAGLELRREPVDLFELAATEVERARLLAPTPTVTLTGGPAPTTGDAQRLGQVLANLLDNARRHAHTRIEVHVTPGEVLVTDDGPGVPAADQERIFDRLVRLDEARTDGGAGLGLAIARGIAEAHGGALTYATDPGAGATFRLRLRPAHRDERAVRRV